MHRWIASCWILHRELAQPQKLLGKGSSWIIDSVVDYTANISKYKPLTGSRYIKLPKELDHLKKCFE